MAAHRVGREQLTGRATLPRVIGQSDLTCQAVNIMVGSSVFVLPGIVLKDLGGWAPLAVLAAAGGVLCIVLSFAEAAGRYREPGGPYRYVGDAFGEYVGVQLALLYWVVRATASAAVANVFVTYFAELWPAAAEPRWRAALLTLVIVGSGGINIRGTRQTASVLDLLTLTKLLPLALLCAAGVFAIAPERLVGTPLPDSNEWARAVLLWVFAFGGFEATLIPAAEVRDPVKDGPRALLNALAIVTLAYVLVQLVVAGTLPGEPSDRPVGQAAGLLFGRPGELLIAVGVLIATSGHIGGSILASSRITFAIADRGGLPAILARVHPIFRTPDVSITVFTLLVWALAISGSFVWNAAISAVGRLLVYAATSLAVLRLRHREASAFRAPTGTHLASVAFCAWLFAHQTLGEAIAVATVLLTGSVLWLGYLTTSRSRGRPNGLHGL